jgi:hypothetical protein
MMMTRPALLLSQRWLGAQSASRRQGILAVLESRNPPHQRLSHDPVLGNNYLMKLHQPHARQIDPSFGRHRLAPL